MEKNDRKILESAQMWMWMTMTKTRWTEKKTDEKVLEKVDERRQLMKSIKTSKIKLLGHGSLISDH